MAQLSRKFTTMAAGRLALLLLSLMTMGVLTRHLGPEGYGYYRTIVAVLTLAMILADAGLGSIFVREFSSRPDSESAILGTGLTLRLLIVLPVLLTGSALLVVLLGGDSSALGILIGFVGFAAYSAHTLIFSVFQQRLKQRGAVFAEIAGGLLLLGSSIVLARIGADVASFVVALALSYLLTLCISLAYLRRLVPSRWHFSASEFRRLAGETAKLVVPATLLVLYIRSDTVLLAALGNLEAVGIYGVPVKLMDAGLGITLLFVGMLTPMLAKSAALESDLQPRILSVSSRWAALVGVSLILGAWCLGPTVIWLLAGPQFADAGAPILIVLTIFLVLHTLALLFRESVVAKRAQSDLVPVYAVAFLLAMLGYLWLIPSLGGLGAALALILAEAGVVAMLWFRLIHLNCRVAATAIAMPALYGCLAAVGTVFVDSLTDLHPLLTALVAQTIYLSLLALTGVLSVEKLTIIVPGRDEGMPSRATGHGIEDHP